MAVPTLTRGRLRRLAELKPESGRVLSVFLDLDPAEFSTGPARATAIGSLMNDAARKVEEVDGLDHDERVALRGDLERVREVLEAPGLATGGTKAIAVYACASAGLLEVVRLSHRIASHACVEDAPAIEPLARLGVPERWVVALVNRRDARVLTGNADGFEDDPDWPGTELHTAEELDHGTPRNVDREVDHHLRVTAERLSRLHAAQPFDQLLLGTPDDLFGAVEGHLHPYVTERLAGRIHVDVENVGADAVREAAAPLIEDHQRARERDALDRWAAGIARGGRATAGLADTLTALNEQRVECLLFEPHFEGRGQVETRTGFLTTDSGGVPIADPQLEPRADILEAAIERAVEQSADVLVVERYPDLGAHGGIGALLRF